MAKLDERWVEKERVLETVNRLFIATDNRDWKAVEECLAARVLFDMTSMAGGDPVVQTPRQITAGWEKGLNWKEGTPYKAKRDADIAAASQ
jgi:hypothetical protein